MDSEFSRKKALVFGVLLLVFLAIPVTIYNALQVQENRTRAEKATVLSLMPSSQTAKANDQINLEININPGINQVDYVKMVINYDPDIFDSSSTSFTLEPASNFQYTADNTSSNGQIIITLDVGSNPTDTVRSPQKIGTLSLAVQDKGLSAGETQVIFNEVLTEIRSIGSTDVYHENVLSSTDPATIIIEATASPTLSPTPIPSITSTPTPTLEPNVTPTISPTPVCTQPDQVQNVNISCPNCGNPTPTQVPAG